MQFNVNEWRKIYDEVQFLGKILKDSQPSLDPTTKKWIPAIQEISKDAFKNISEEIDLLLIKNTQYLDGCEMNPNPPLWHYNSKDKSTFVSDTSFKYDHLIKPVVKRCIIGFR